MVFEAITLVLALAAMALIGVGTIRTGVPPLPTSPGVRRTMMAMLPNQVTGVIAELGSGWGGLARALAGRYPECRVIGYELSPLPYWVARAWQGLWPCANLEFRRADFMAAELSHVGLVVCYLYPGRMKELATKLRDELEPGTPVLSNFFALPDWHPTETRAAPDFWSSPVYLYAAAPNAPNAPGARYQEPRP